MAAAHLRSRIPPSSPSPGTRTTTTAPRVAPVGDAALLVELGDRVDLHLNRRVHALARALQARPGVVDTVPGYASLLLKYDPARLDYWEVEAMVQAELASPPSRPTSHSRLRLIPTVYGGEYGPDLSQVARQLNLSEQEVVRLHSGCIYRVYMLGFAPGFAYLGELPEELAISRLPTPRPAVPAGSVGIAGRQTGIYSLPTPGGWRIIGRTSLRLFDPGEDPPTYLEPGDRVRFVPTGRPASHAVEEGPVQVAACPTSQDPALDILFPGFLTLIQDLGRPGYAKYGIPPSGAADAFAARAANLLVGNHTGDAVLEITMAGPVVRFRRDCLIAIAGADLAPRIDGVEVPGWTACAVRSGSVLEFDERRSGMRAYLAVAGGIQVTPVLGSRSTYARGGFGGLGGRALRSGDLLDVGTPSAPPARLAGRYLPPERRPSYRPHPEIRVVLGPHQDRFPPTTLETFLSATYTVAPVSDRMGYRLLGPALERREPADILSIGMPLGGIQVPGDGQPIALMSDHQTTGGYPLIAVVASADLPLMAQLAPGDSLRFRAVSLDEARAAYLHMLSDLEGMMDDESGWQAGWMS